MYICRALHLTCNSKFFCQKQRAIAKLIMGMSSNCCLNILPPPPLCKSIPAVKALAPRAEGEEKPWRRNSPKFVRGLACAIIGLEMAKMPNIDQITREISMGSGKAVASEMSYITTEKEHKWSDRRRCPPWKLNSLETIVPENLPRPSAHRKWEDVANHSPTAPPLKTVIVVKSKLGCFSM